MKVTCPHCNRNFEPKKRVRKFSTRNRDPILKLRKILNFLKTQDEWVWVRRIAKQTGLKPYSVSYLVEKYLREYVEMLEPSQVYESTGIRMRMIRLKNIDLNIDSTIKEISIRTNS